MQSNKQETVNLNNIQYHLYVLQKINKGLSDVKKGKVYTQAEMEERMAKWVNEKK